MDSVLFSYILNDSEDDSIVERKRKVFKKRIDNLNLWDDQEFIARYRVSKEVAILLCHEIEDEIKLSTEKNLAVKPLDQILVTLQYYASGSFMRCIGDMSGLHKSTVCRIIHRVTRAIAKLRPQYINLPATVEERLEVATDFYRIARFPKVLGAIDCTHVQILSPEMENKGPGQGAHHRRELTPDPVKAQGILKSVVRKEQAAKQCHQRWSFYTRTREIQEEEAQKLGMTLEEYRAAVLSLNNQPEHKPYTDVLEPSPAPLPPTSSGMIGRRARCPLERYGRLVRTGRDLPLRPPLPPGQVYDPYVQTMVFLGSIAEGDPISYKLPAKTVEVDDAMWARPQQLQVTPLELYFREQNHGR